MARIRWPVILALVATIVLLRLGLIWADRVDTPGSTLTLALGFLLPIGFALVAWSALPADQSDSAAGLATLALAMALIGYLGTGFGLQFGGVAFVSANEELEGLARFFSLVRGDASAEWGFFGLEGFFLNGDANTPAALQLFMSQLPLVAAVVLIAMLGMPSATPLPASLLTGLIVAALTHPLAGNWVNGGGWLANLGNTLSLGHGTIDFAGSGTIFVLGGATVMAAASVFGRKPHSQGEGESLPEAAMPPAQFPLLPGLGALLAMAGWIAVGLANPLYVEAGETLNWSLIAINGLAGLAGGTVSAQLYSWFTTGRFDPLMGPRGALAGLAAISAGAPFVPTWAALVIGAVAGLLLPLAVFAVEHVIRRQDNTAAIASYLLPGLWGLLAVALFADGRWGVGWNGTDGPSGQGVTGLIVARGLQPDAGQLAAQFWGSVALLILGFLIPWGVFKLFAALARLRLPDRRHGTQRENAPAEYTTANALNPSSESQGAAGGPDRVVNVDDRE